MLNYILVLASAVVATFAVAALALLTNLVAVTAQDLVVLAEADPAPTPCGLALPGLYRLRAGLGAFGSSGIASILDSTGSLLDDTRTSLCSSASAVQAVGSVFESHYVPGGGVWDETEVANAVCSESNIFNYKLRELDGERYVDPLLRVTRAYVAAAPAFARLGSCTALLNSLDTDCTHGAAPSCHSGQRNYFNRRVGGTDADVVRDDQTYAPVLAETDAKSDGGCFLNPSPEPPSFARRHCWPQRCLAASSDCSVLPCRLRHKLRVTASSDWTDVQSAWFVTSSAIHGSTAECDTAGAKRSSLTAIRQLTATAVPP